MLFDFHNFKVIYEFRNLSHAALALNSSQPTLSKSLKRVEEHFDEELFTRTGSGLIPNGRAEDLYSLISEMEKGLLSFRQKKSKPVDHKINLGLTLVWEFIFPRLTALQEQAQIHLDTSENCFLFDKIARGDCDFALCRFHPEGALKKGLIFEPVFKIRLALFKSDNESFWKDLDFVKIHNLQKDDLSPKGEQEILHRHDNPKITVDGFNTLIKILKGGRYWTILPDLFEAELREQRIYKAEDSDSYFKSYWCGIAYPEDTPYRSLIDAIKLDMEVHPARMKLLFNP